MKETNHSQGELEKEKNPLADIMLDSYKNGEFKMHSSAPENAIKQMAMIWKDYLGDAENFITTEVLSPEHGDFVVTVQRRGKLSPAEKIGILGTQISSLEAKLSMASEMLERFNVLDDVVQDKDPDNGAIADEISLPLDIDILIEIKKLCASLSSPIKETNYREEWMPIESAPLDETIVDLWVEASHPKYPTETMGLRMTDCWFDPNDKVWLRTGSFEEIDVISEVDGLKITHWKAIPQPPALKPINKGVMK